MVARPKVLDDSSGSSHTLLEHGPQQSWEKQTDPAPTLRPVSRPFLWWGPSFSLRLFLHASDTLSFKADVQEREVRLCLNTFSLNLTTSPWRSLGCDLIPEVLHWLSNMRHCLNQSWIQG